MVRHGIMANAAMHRGWGGIHGRIEEHEEGTVIYAEHRGLVSMLGELIERLMDRFEEPIRKTVWPYIGGKK